ncbi:MAG: cation:proton antiporter, partial [archaeon]
LEVGVVFAAAAIAGGVADRLGQSVIPFYILVGMGLGEFTLGRMGLPYVTESSVVVVGAELGIVFLLFFLGLEFNLDRLLARRAQITRAGTIDFLVNFGAGLLLGWIVFGTVIPAVLLAGIVYISSSAVITKSLIDLGWIANDEAEPILGTLVFEDLLIAVYLAVMTAVVLGSDGLEAIAIDVGIALGFILALLIASRIGTEWIQHVVSTDSHEFLVLRALGVTVSVAGVALSIGVSEAVAAFFVGMAFSTIDYEDLERLERLLEPLRDAFAAIFFVWNGLVTDPLALGGVVGLIALAVFFTTPTKLLSGYLGGRVFDLDRRRSTRVALGMTTRGEFSLIVATVAISGAGAGTIAPALAETINAFAVGYVLVMATLGTTLMQYSGPIETFVVSRLRE